MHKIPSELQGNKATVGRSVRVIGVSGKRMERSELRMLWKTLKILSVIEVQNEVLSDFIEGSCYLMIM